jgi:RNA polymerase sigma factor (sigma-70 family)
MTSTFSFLHSDARILDLMKKGDDDALVQLFESNKRMVISYILKNNGTEEDADDMLQEAVIVLWENVRSGRFEYTSKLSTYIFAVVQNMWKRKLSRAKREIPGGTETDESIADDPSALDLMINEEQVQQMRAALRRLDEVCRRLLLLFYWEECSMEEISRRMKFANAETAKSKKYQCKKALEKILNDERIF